MSAISNSDILKVWELGEDMSDRERMSLLLSLSEPSTKQIGWAQRTIGECNGCLLDLRRSTFGDTADGYTTCPECEERIELRFDLPRLHRAASSAKDGLSFSSGGFEIQFRLPTLSDLEEVSSENSLAVAVVRLLNRCILSVRKGGNSVSQKNLPDSVRQALADYMGQCDPDAETILQIACPNCACRFPQEFDISRFLWKEVRWHARRLLSDVDELARAYGWTESEILALGARRRRSYLELIRS